MKRFAAAICVFLTAFCLARAQDAATEPARTAPAPIPKPEYHRSGTLNVVKDADGKVSGVKLIIWTYDLVVEDSAKDILELDGKRVRVFGSFVEKEGKRCISVKRFESLEPAEAQPAQ